jgi:uncharacterized protein
MSPVAPVRGGVQLRLQVQPRAARSELAGLHGDALKVRLKSPPVGGAANEELVRFLAAALGVPASSVTVVAGHSGRRKTVRVVGIGAVEAGRLLGLATD